MVTFVVRSIAAIAIPTVIVHRAGSALLPRFALRPHGLLLSRDAGFVARPEVPRKGAKARASHGQRSLHDLSASVATRPMALGPLVINIRAFVKSSPRCAILLRFYWRRSRLLP
jgi:hypothetical protein